MKREHEGKAVDVSSADPLLFCEFRLRARDDIQVANFIRDLPDACSSLSYVGPVLVVPWYPP